VSWTQLIWWRRAMRDSRAVALLLLAMSVASWVVILWKALAAAPGRHDVARSVAGVLAGAVAGRCAQRLSPLTARRWCCR
jgi:biopolymer transport protein ExbB